MKDSKRTEVTNTSVTDSKLKVAEILRPSGLCRMLAAGDFNLDVLDVQRALHCSS